MELSQQPAKNNKPWRWGPADYTVKGTAFPTLSHSPSYTCNTYINKHACHHFIVHKRWLRVKVGWREMDWKRMKTSNQMFVLGCCTRQGKQVISFLSSKIRVKLSNYRSEAVTESLSYL